MTYEQKTFLASTRRHTSVFILILSPNVSAVTARTALGFRWPNTPRDVLFRCDFATAEREAVRSAMQAWNGVKDPDGRSPVSMYLSSGTASSSIERGYLDDDALGVTQPILAAGSSTNLYGVKIILNSNKSFSVGAQSGKYDIQSVVQHELGHALGVAHCHTKGGAYTTPTCPNNVMCPTLGTGTTRRTFKAYDTASYIVIYWG